MGRITNFGRRTINQIVEQVKFEGRVIESKRQWRDGMSIPERIADTVDPRRWGVYRDNQRIVDRDEKHRRF